MSSEPRNNLLPLNYTLLLPKKPEDGYQDAYNGKTDAHEPLQ
jgi:hypothetical protein